MAVSAQGALELALLQSALAAGLGHLEHRFAEEKHLGAVRSTLSHLDWDIRFALGPNPNHCFDLQQAGAGNKLDYIVAGLNSMAAAEHNVPHRLRKLQGEREPPERRISTHIQNSPYATHLRTSFISR